MRGLVDTASKVIAASYDYSAFGKQSLTNDVFNPWQYASKRFDSDLRLIDFGKRFYDPSLGRWLAVDPAGFINSHNLYQFNFNNPFCYVDPDGQFIFAIPFLCGAFGIGATGAVVVAIEITAADVIISSLIAGAAFWGINEGLTRIDHAKNSRPFVPYHQQATEEETKQKEKAKKTKRHTPDQEALNDLVKDNLKEGVPSIDADTLLDWANEYGFPARDDRGKPIHWEGGEHIHVGREHVKII